MDQFRFEELKVYQKSLDYIDYSLTLTRVFPAFEQFELCSQFRRVANSISLNIGDGEGGTPKEFANFLRISRRSMRECLVCTTLAHRRKYITDQQNRKSRGDLTEMSKMISGLNKSLNIQPKSSKLRTPN